MTRRIAVGIACGLAAVALSMAWPKSPRLVLSTTASVPVGLYVVRSAPLQRGRLVLVEPPPAVRRFTTARGYLHPRSQLLKTVAALPGDRVCRWRSSVWIAGTKVATARDTDARHRPLPIWRSCHVLPSNQVFLLGSAGDSFDSRYFGPIDMRYLIGAAFPLWTHRPRLQDYRT